MKASWGKEPLSVSSFPLSSHRKRPSESAPDGEILDSRRTRILVVDDEPAIRVLLARTLAAGGYLVDVAVDAEEALSGVQKRRYDGLITDLKMPGTNGRELYGLIEKIDSGLARRVIFMTGDTATDRSRAFITGTGNPLIEKPFDLATVELQVREHIGGPVRR